MDGSRDQVRQLIQRIRRRWRRRALIQGGAVTAILALVLATLLLVGYVQFDLPAAVYLTAIGASILVVAAAGVQYILRPALRTVTDQQIALYVEEKIPDLEDRLNSAVEVSGEDSLPAEQRALIDRLIDDAAQKTEEIPLTTVVERGAERLLSYAAAGVLALFLVVGFLSLDELQQAFTNMQELPTALTRSPLAVRPGDTEVEKGDSQEIIAEVRDESGGTATLHFKSGDGQWQDAEMQQGIGEPAFLHEFSNIQEPIQYTVEVGDKRAGPFTISLYEFPEVQQIDVTYDYPDYSARPVRTEENAGDIRGLEGSTVTVSVTTKGSVVEAVMERDDGSAIPLEKTGDNQFRATFTLDAKDFYRIQLTDDQDKQNKFSQQYLIQPVADEKPFISLEDPGRDIRANAIQEVLVAADVQDDFGVKKVELNYSVNGREEQSVSLANPDSIGSRSLSGEHLFFLEEYALEPGDVISYYIEAEDFAPSNRAEATDMYFIEVMPFDQRFSQVNNASGGGGGGQPSGTVLSQQQIITATWKLYRQRNEMPDEEYQSSLESLVQGQSNLRQNIEQRLSSTAFSTELQNSEKHQQIVASLREAVKAMKAADQQLSDGQLRSALTPERQALNHLLRAEAANKERQLAMQRNRGGSAGGSASAREERMSELMDLELDISKDKYEMQQRSSGSPQQQRSQALDRIRELAQKQEQLLERQQREIEGEDKKRFVDRLEREQQQLQRQAQNLAQQMRQQARQRGQQSGQMDEQLNRITDQMNEASRSLRKQDVQQARSQQQQALNELQRMRRKLEMENTDDLRTQLEDFTQRFDQLKQEEEALGEEIRETLNEARSNNGRLNREKVENLTERQGSLKQSASDLREHAQTLRKQSQADNPELANDLENLVRRMEQTNLEQNIRDSEQALDQGWLDYARRKQDDIEQSLDQLSGHMQEFNEQLPHTQEEQLTESLEQVRDLTNRMREIQRQARAVREAQKAQARNRQSPDRQAPDQQQGQQAQNQSAQQSQQGTQSQPGQSSQQQSQQQPQQAGASGQPSAGSSQRVQAQSRRLQQELDRAQQSIDHLREQVDNNQQARRQLNQLESYIRRARADYTGVLLDEESADQFFSQEIYRPLSDLELNLARELDALTMEKKLYGARRGDVPREYQPLVEKYYERLSKSADQ